MSYRIDLEIFNGPMDLLLYLIAKEEVDIQDVTISRIVDQYMAYLEHLRELNVEITSDFVVMASSLMLIKSKALLPTEEIDLDEDLDQQDELIQHLLEYKKVRMLSRALDEVGKVHGMRYPRPPHPESPMEETFSEEEVNLWDILRAFAKIVKETGMDRRFEVVHSEKPISDYLSAILVKLEKQQSLPFEDLFMGERSRSEAISHFIGLLELIRRNIVVVRTDGNIDSSLQVTLCLDQKGLDALKVDGQFRVEMLMTPDEEPEAPHFIEEEAPAEGTETAPPDATPLLEGTVEETNAAGGTADEAEPLQVAEPAATADAADVTEADAADVTEADAADVPGAETTDVTGVRASAKKSRSSDLAAMDGAV